MKRVSLLSILALMAFGAVNASACVECRGTNPSRCVVVQPFEYPAANACGFDEDGCCFDIDSGLCGTGAARASLASQYVVASVERLDEPRITITSKPTETTQSSPNAPQNR
jgi:hypothetical protein